MQPLIVSLRPSISLIFDDLETILLMVQQCICIRMGLDGWTPGTDFICFENRNREEALLPFSNCSLLGFEQRVLLLAMPRLIIALVRSKLFFMQIVAHFVPFLATFRHLLFCALPQIRTSIIKIRKSLSVVPSVLLRCAHSYFRPSYRRPLHPN